MENVKNTGKLYLNMILKEDEPVDMVRRSIDSVREHVDGMYITLTYSDVYDEHSPLCQFLRDYGAVLSFYQWTRDFAAARQYALNQVPKGENIYIYWQDADDVLQNASEIRGIFRDALTYKHAAVFLNYWYRVEVDEAGEVKEILIEHKRERIIRNDDTFTWKGMLHETLIEQKSENVAKVLRKEAWVIHLTEEGRIDGALDRNIEILENQAAIEQHKDPRTLVYLAKGYFDRGMMITGEMTQWHQKALLLFDEYLEGSGKLGDKDYVEGSGWRQERSNAWELVSEIFKFKGEYEAALQAIDEAIEEAPEFPMYYVDKALLYSLSEDYTKAEHWLKIATSIDMPETTIITMPRDLKLKALECDARIALYKRDMKRYKQDMGLMLQITPENKDLKDRYVTATSLEASNKAAQCVVFLGKYLEQINEQDKIQALLSAVPNDLQTEKFYSEMRHRFIPPRIHESNEITILCGPGFEEWSPLSLEKGLGGSEEAVVHLSRELAKQGWKVTVYANPSHEKGEYEGVTYLPYYDFNISDIFNVLILWRGIGMVDFQPKSKFTMLWMHDMPQNPDFTEERLSHIQKIAVLSEFHKEQFRMLKKDGSFAKLPDSAFFVTRNGIPDLSKYVSKPKEHSIIYSSSPDRGLLYLLLNWSKIREKVSDATLEIYYGFDVYDAFYKDNPARMKWKAKVMKLMEQEGIIYHGRVGHPILHEAMSRAAVWAYPTDFTEISCITAMKAQALGAVPVVTDFGALTETVRNGLKLDPKEADIQTKEGQQAYVDALCELLQSPTAQEEYRRAMVPWARQYFSWERVASEWSTLFKSEGNVVAKPVIMTPDEFQKAFAKKGSVQL